MDVISGLPDDFLVKILSFLPTKAAVSTSLLSKRWEFLWLWLPKLEYVTSSLFEYRRLRCFLNKTLPLHRAPIKSFRLVTYPYCKPEDVKSWFLVSVSRHLRMLDTAYKAFWGKENLLPSSLFACKSLVVLKLCGYILLDVPRKVSLPSLKTLQLQEVTGVDGESLQRLLSVCPVLENLLVNSCYGSGNISVIIPSLQRLTIYNVDDVDKIEIDSPSLKYLKLKVFNKVSSYISVGLPKLEEAYVDVNVNDIDGLMGSITSVKRLTLCCSSAVYSSNFVFNQLEHLKLCDCTASLMNRLARLPKDSPNLRELDIFHMGAHASSYMVGWNEPSNVPECFLSTLQTFNWSGYLGRPQDKDIVVYILKNARRLKTVTISSGELALTKKFQMIKELSNSPRASTTCQLIFD